MFLFLMRIYFLYFFYLSVCIPCTDYLCSQYSLLYRSVIPWESPPLVKTPMALPVPVPTSSSWPSLPVSPIMLSFLSKESRFWRILWPSVLRSTSSASLCIAMFGGLCPPDDTRIPLQENDLDRTSESL